MNQQVTGTGEPPAGTNAQADRRPFGPIDPPFTQDGIAHALGPIDPPHSALRASLIAIYEGERADVDPLIYAGSRTLSAYVEVACGAPAAPPRKNGPSGNVGRGQQSGRNWAFTLLQELGGMVKVSRAGPRATVAMQGAQPWSAMAPSGADLVQQAAATMTRAAAAKAAGLVLEIVSQAQAIELLFALELGARPGRHDRTIELIETVSAVVSTPLYEAKRQMDVLRPSVVAGQPHVPVIPVPGHASFPSGHGTAAHALADVLIAVTKADAGAQCRLKAMASRIAENRIDAGLHTRSDTDAGASLGAAFGQWLQSAGLLGASAGWKALWDAAGAEW